MSNNSKDISSKAMFLANILFALSVALKSSLISYSALITWMISLILKIREEKSKVLIGVYSTFIVFIIGIIIYSLLV